MPSSVPVVKKGLRQFWQTTAGLRPDDGVVVRSAPVAPDELAPEQITLGDVAAPQARAGLGRKEERPSMTCWIRIQRPGSDEDAVDAARDRVYELLALVEQSLRADPSAAGTIPPPAGTTVSESALEEYPSGPDGTATRVAQLRFTISWTSHGI